MRDGAASAADLPDGTSDKFLRGDLDNAYEDEFVGEFRLYAHAFSRLPACMFGRWTWKDSQVHKHDNRQTNAVHQIKLVDRVPRWPAAADIAAVSRHSSSY